MNAWLFGTTALVCLFSASILFTLAARSRARRGLRIFAGAAMAYVGGLYLIASLVTLSLLPVLIVLRNGTLVASGVMVMAGAVAALAWSEAGCNDS